MKMTLSEQGNISLIIMEYTLATLEKELSDFPTYLFVKKSVHNLAEEMERRGVRGAVFGASGGIDSLVTAALCVSAGGKRSKYRIIGLQMNDLRVKGEHYNPETYQNLGVELVQYEITSEAVAMEKRLGLPPRWLTVFLTQLLIRRLPIRVGRSLIQAIKSGQAPRWALSHFQLLTLLHRLRITKLKEYAERYRLMLIVCANLTEKLLGYFVEQGVDDTQMGDYAPLSDLYKLQVIRTARMLGLPQRVVRQKPSPGFGGIYDEDIVGPYELVDRALIGIHLGYSDAEISQALKGYTNRSWKQGVFRRRNLYGIQFVRFLRQLADLSRRKKVTP